MPAPLDPLVEVGRDEFSAGVWWLQPWKCLQLMMLGHGAHKNVFKGVGGAKSALTPINSPDF